MQNMYSSHQHSFLFKHVIKHQGLIADGIYRALKYSILKRPNK